MNYLKHVGMVFADLILLLFAAVIIIPLGFLFLIVERLLLLFGYCVIDLHTGYGINVKIVHINDLNAFEMHFPGRVDGLYYIPGRKDSLEPLRTFQIITMSEHDYKTFKTFMINKKVNNYVDKL